MTLSRPDRMATAGGAPCRPLRRLCRGTTCRPHHLRRPKQGQPRPLQHYLSMSFLSRSKPEYMRVLAVLSGQPWISAISSSLKPW